MRVSTPIGLKSDIFCTVTMTDNGMQILILQTLHPWILNDLLSLIVYAWNEISFEPNRYYFKMFVIFHRMIIITVIDYIA